jgi:GNAT superfamily N-acetyltransferase
VSGRRGEIRLVDDRIDSPVGAELVAELLDELAARYGGPDPDEPTPLDLSPPRGAFFVAWVDGVAAGCGGVRAYDGDDRAVGEIKRMYTRPSVRRRGIARRLLGAIERRARDLGYTRLVLETGTKQPEAMELYVAAGYAPITPYGEYKDYPESRCYAKDLLPVEEHR